MAGNNRKSQIEILLVEDSISDVRLTDEAFKESRVLNNLSVVRNGLEALDFLNRKEKYADAPRPDLILLDLNLPKKNGCEVLSEIKADPKLRRIPVVVLTVSNSEQDIMKSYDLHANCYINKPVEFKQLIRIVKSIENFWLNIVVLPPDGKNDE
jgi:chemotaxis family two-component system response regulator Rcp1